MKPTNSASNAHTSDRARAVRRLEGWCHSVLYEPGHNWVPLRLRWETGHESNIRAIHATGS